MTEPFVNRSFASTATVITKPIPNDCPISRKQWLRIGRDIADDSNVHWMTLDLGEVDGDGSRDVQATAERIEAGREIRFVIGSFTGFKSAEKAAEFLMEEIMDARDWR